MDRDSVDHWPRSVRVNLVGAVFLIAVAMGLASVASAPAVYGDGAVLTQASFRSTTIPTGVGYINGVDCLSSVLCYAAGQTTGTDQSGLVLRYSGGTWNKTIIPSVRYLTGVSCEDADVCWATGVSYSQGKLTGVVVGTKDGTKWSEPSQPGASGSGSGVALNAVSCFGTSCMAVGTSFDSTGKLKSDLWVTDETGNWKAATVPKVNGGRADLVSVSCDALDDCWVVGGGVWHTSNSGQSWSQLDPVATGGNVAPWSLLTAVQFTSPNDGTVAGGDQCGGPVTHCSGAIYQTNDGGSTWKLVSGSSTPFIDDLSCGPVGAGPCVATSSTFAPSTSSSQANVINGATLLDSSVGSSWQTMQKVSGPNFPALACPQVGACLLVGGNESDNVGDIYVENATVVSLSRGTGKGYCAHAYPGRGYALGPHVDNVWACGPTPLSSGGDSGPKIPEFWPIDDKGGFQCTELAVRYLYDVSGILINVLNDSPTHWNGTGKNFASYIGSYLHVPVGRHVDGHKSAKPQDGDILSEMVGPNESDNEAGSNARTYGDVGVVISVSGDTIELMVENNNGAGTNTIVMSSATSWNINQQSAGYLYTNFAWFAPPASMSTVSMPTSAYKYEVVGAGTVNEYSSITTSSTVQAVLPTGNTIDVVCQKAGADVNGSLVWDQLSNGGWISDSYTTTPNFDTFSYPIPLCINPRSWAFKAMGASTIQERAGPSTSDAVVGTLGDGDAIHIVCQTSGTRAGGSTVWDYQVNRSYVPDADVSTPSGGQYDVNIPMCPYAEEYVPNAT